MDIKQAIKEAEKQISQAICLRETSPGVYNTGLSVSYDRKAEMLSCLVREIIKLEDRLGHYAEMEEQGRLVELPCNIGDTVRAVVNRPYNGHDLTIFGDVSDIQTIVRVAHSGCRHVNFLISDFEKTVFLTKKETNDNLKEQG